VDNDGAQKPFIKGRGCSKCSNGLGWCSNGLCQISCRGPSSGCECPLVCGNCGTVDKTRCTCKCTPGWTGLDCTELCVNSDPNCGANPGWPKQFCKSGSQQEVIRKKCPLLCGLCEYSANPIRCHSAWTMWKPAGCQWVVMLTSFDIFLTFLIIFS
jgi:hypothetical protein